MSFPLERTWQHAWNTSPASIATSLAMAQSTLQFLKNLMKGTQAVTDASGNPIASPTGTWPVAGSSSSSAAGMDGVDRLPAYTNWVHNTATNPHSWVVLGPGPNGGYLNIDFANASGNYYANCYHSKSAPTGGSTTARPTATDETDVLVMQLNDGTPNGTGAWFLHGLLSSSGDVFVGVNVSGGGQLQYSFIWLYPADFNAADVVPWAMYSEFTSSQPGAPSTLFWSQASLWKFRVSANGDAQGVSAQGMGMQPSCSLGSFSSLFPTTGDAISHRYPSWPFPLVSDESGGNVTLRGRVVDLRCAGRSLSVGNGGIDPASGTPDAVMLGVLWLPVNVTSVSL